MGKPLVKENTDDKDSFVDELKPGTKLMHGQYTIESFLNAGGFGITYLARDSLDRKIVIKECFPGAFCRRSRYVVQARSRAHQNELKSIVRLFVQEARSLAKLDHPNIVGVHQVFEDNETAYMALDFVEGRDLLDTIEDPNHGLTPTQIKVILKEALGAVGFIHEQGILHRDISPDNILINAQFHPVLIDFGAAREQATKQSRVLSALRVVKDGYSPQEFYIAGSEQGPSSDLYALAASFYHLIAKQVPPNSQARLAAVASSEPDPYVPLVGRITEYEDSFLAAIDKALAVLPKDRLQSAREWLDMMDGLPGNVTPLKVGTAIKPAAKAAPVIDVAAPQQKSKLPMLLGSAAVLAIMVGVGVMLMPGRDDTAVSTVVAVPSDTPPVVVTETAVLDQPATAPASAPPAFEPAAPDLPAAPVQSANVAPDAIADPAPVMAEAQPTPTLTTDTAAPEIGTGTDAGIIGGPVAASDDIATPEIRPVPRADAVEIAAMTAVVTQPVPEPVMTPRPTSTEPAAAIAFPELRVSRSIVETEMADLVFAATPESVAAVGNGLIIDIDAVTPGNELPPPSVVSVWSVQLPFQSDAPGSNVVGALGAVTPVWVRPGLEITAVNGTPIDSIGDIPATLRANQQASQGDTVQVVFGTRDPATGETADRAWIMPVIQDIVMLNGIRFQSSFAGSNWRTVVVDVPSNTTSDLRPGDIVTSYIPTSERITARDTLATILEREIDTGTTQFMFAVQREGSMWVASMNMDQ
ncbi:serine/threonine protein kinase [Yoonia sp.]|uniref:serine/threonine protein kinase n=1 Tax=Yoonia sp. TaxID=2212373 RepID=UPI001A049832|nr:serine/threonine protein kinase [Yoonia sp.]MBE0412315.1 protein kinase [Yoonia sp.]